MKRRDAAATEAERERIIRLLEEQCAAWHETYPDAWPPFKGMAAQLAQRIRGDVR